MTLDDITKSNSERLEKLSTHLTYVEKQLMNHHNDTKDRLDTLEIAYDKMLRKLEQHSEVLDDIARNMPRGLK